MKVKHILLDAVKDYMIPHVIGKNNAFDMWAAPVKLYQSNNQNQKMVLREKLRDTKMTKTDNVTSYITRISQVCDELDVVGEKMDD